MPTYLSTHITACMTRQALTQLIVTLQAATEVTLVRASASQMEGRLVCEFEAPDQETLLQFFAANYVMYDWIIRVELAWGSQAVETAPGQEAAENPLPRPDTDSGGHVSPSPSAPPHPDLPPPGGKETQHTTMEPRAATSLLPSRVEAKVLHILRTLRDESAWQIIAAQYEAQPVAVLLLHDAVLDPPPLDVPMFACESDVLARGISSPLSLLTYAQIVELIFACERVIVW